MPTPRAIHAAAGLLCVQMLAMAIAHGQAPPAAAPTPASGLQIHWRQPLTYRGTVALASGPATVFAAGPDGYLAAFARADGRALWSAPLASSLAPAVGPSLVAVATASELVALQQADGTLAWRAALESPATTLIAREGGFLTTSAAGLQAWRADGVEAWRAALDAEPAALPAVRGGLLLVATVEPALVAFDTDTGRRHWRIPLAAAPRGLAVGPDRVFVDADDALRAYRLTGAPDPDWSHRLVKAIGTPVPDDAHVYFSLIDNTVRAMDRSGGSTRWSRVVPTRPASGPMLVDKVLVVALSTGEVVEISPSNGKVLPAPPPTDLAGHRLRAAVAAGSPLQVFTVSAGSDGLPMLVAWGRPPTAGPR